MGKKVLEIIKIFFREDVTEEEIKEVIDLLETRTDCIINIERLG